MDFAIKGYLFEYYGKYLRVVRPLNSDADQDNLLKPGEYVLKLDKVPELTNERLDIITCKQKVMLVVRRQQKNLELTLG